MTDLDPSRGDSPAAPPDKDTRARRKGRQKVRSAWIAFAGRVLAQVVGAVATVVLGVYVASQFARSRDDAGSRAAAAPAARAVRPAGREAALVVLPFENFSGDPQRDYIVDGITEALIADLARIGGLRVISRTSAMHYKTEKKPVSAIAAELDVDLIVEGSVSMAADRLRVTAQLIDAGRDEHIWARTYDHAAGDVLSMQTAVASAIAAEVRGVVPAAANGAALVRRAVDPGAYDLYLRGRHAWNRRTPEDFEEARKYFELAIAKEPGFALAYAGLADTYQLASATRGDSEGAARATEAARRALQLDDTLAEAHTALAATLHWNGADVPAAEREFRRALELNPGYATTHQWYAILLAEEGRNQEALRHAERACALDPLSATMVQTRGLVRYYSRRYDQAIADTRRALELAPHLPLARAILARSLVARGTPRDAIPVLAGAAAAGAEERALLAAAHARAGDATGAAAIHAELLARTPLPAAALARYYAATGEARRALEMLERAASARPAAMQTLKNDPMFEKLRTQPRFAALLAGQP